MPTCYHLSVCQSASLDSSTNNWSLFQLIEQVATTHFPTDPLPFQIHAYWHFSERELNMPFQFRFVFTRDQEDVETTETRDLISKASRYRLRAIGLPPIPTAGYYWIKVEWRREGSDNWSREEVTWPLEVREIETPSGRAEAS